MALSIPSHQHVYCIKPRPAPMPETGRQGRQRAVGLQKHGKMQFYNNSAIFCPFFDLHIELLLSMKCAIDYVDIQKKIFALFYNWWWLLNAVQKSKTELELVVLLLLRSPTESRSPTEMHGDIPSLYASEPYSLATVGYILQNEQQQYKQSKTGVLHCSPHILEHIIVAPLCWMVGWAITALT